jgi:DNA modification methylase
VDRQLGLERTAEEYIAKMVAVFREVRRVMHPTATLWLNMGDSYVAGPTGHQDISAANGKAAQMFAKGGRYRVDNMRKDLAKERGNLPPKSLMMMPARLAIAMQDDGWLLRSEIVWCKKAPMPESCRDRPTSATEKIYLFARQGKYFYDADAIKETSVYQPGGKHSEDVKQGGFNDKGPIPGSGQRSFRAIRPERNAWNYWLLSPEAYADAHFATFPTEIPRRAISAGTSQHGHCAVCGAGWRRVVERGELVQNGHTAKDPAKYRGVPDGWDKGHAVFGQMHPGMAYQNHTTGWQPSCAHHDAPIQPGLVLDCFSGAGTTVMVARRLGRRGIGIELSAQYAAMSRQRIMGDNPMDNLEAVAERIEGRERQSSFEMEANNV